MDAGWTTIIVSCIAAVGGMFSSVISMHNKSKIDRIEISIDGRLQQLLDASVNSGRIAERTDQRDIAAGIPLQSTATKQVEFGGTPPPKGGS